MISLAALAIASATLGIPDDAKRAMVSFCEASYSMAENALASERTGGMRVSTFADSIPDALPISASLLRTQVGMMKVGFSKDTIDAACYGAMVQYWGQ